MMTLRQFAAKPETIPVSSSWYLADLGEALGKQELFTKQSPQRLKVLREHAIIESAVSSNRMEGVEVEQARVGTVLFGRWHNEKHDPWPYVNYILHTLKTAYQEFEQRVGRTAAPKGAKTELVTNAINRMTGLFSVAVLQRECPGVSVDMIRQILKSLRSDGKVQCLGRGRTAQWRKTK